MDLKLLLIKNNGIFIENLKLKYPYISRDNSGPGQKRKSIFLKVDNKIVRTPISKRKNFVIRYKNGKIALECKGSVLSNDVEILPIGIHCPGQAFLNVYGCCIFRCSFCSCGKEKSINMKLESSIKTLEKIKDRIDAIAITSGIHKSIKRTNEDLIIWLKEMKKFNLPIGIETIVSEEKEIEEFFGWGAEEIKINIQAANEQIYRKIGAPLSYNRVIEMLGYAVDTFGKGKVSSNLICGLGEKKEHVVRRLEELCSMGISVNLRFLRPQKDLPLSISENDMLYLAKRQKEIYEKYALHPETFKTMCHKCTACDIVPYIDL